MQKVNIYIDQWFTGNFGCGDGKFSVLLEVETQKGTRTREHYRGYTGTSKNRLAILACIEALSHMTQPCSVMIHIDSPYMVASADRLTEWKQQGIENRKNGDLWKKYIELEEKHLVSFVYEKKNPYTPAMKIQINTREIIITEDYRPENER